MKAHTTAPTESTTQTKIAPRTPESAGVASTFGSQHPEAITQRQRQHLIASSPQAQQQKARSSLLSQSAVQMQSRAENHHLRGTAQRVEEEEPLQGQFKNTEPTQRQTELAPRANGTGLPNQLKAGIESLSGISLDHVKVHYNSTQPAQLNALAYAQGHDIHVGPGQEQHLPHEAWHVVQQAQGRVKPTMQMKEGVPVNDDAGLEHEADVMGAKALQLRSLRRAQSKPQTSTTIWQMRAAATAIRQFFDGDYADPLEQEKLAEKQKEGIADIKLTKALQFQKWRKLNRLAGQINNANGHHRDLNLAALKGHIRNLMTAAVGDAVDVSAIDGGLYNAVHTECLRLVTASKGLDIDGNDFEILSMFGPLENWLLNGAQTQILNLLRDLRHEMALRKNISVVAHRGNGPTNRTRGGLIAQDDPRRLNREAENSPDAFKSAYAVADQGGLDGIECDVFLSKDEIPILSHEGAVQEQLSTIQQGLNAAITAQTHIEDMTASELQAVQRTSKPGSNFITLAEFLASAKDAADNYYKLHKKPFRIEIEMKGKPGSSSVSKLSDPNTYKLTLKNNVAKTISQFKKGVGNGIPFEIIVFNNDVADATSFSDLRAKKSQLGNLYTGLGTESSTDGEKANVDELRMGAKPEVLGKIANKKYDKFILTLVPGAEAPLHDDPIRPTHPFKELIWTPSKLELQRLVDDFKKKEEMIPLRTLAASTSEAETKDFTQWLQTIEEERPEIAGYEKQIKYIEGVNADMAKQGVPDALTIQNILKKVAENKIEVKNIHLLTDSPANGQDYKASVLKQKYPKIQDWDMAYRDFEESKAQQPEEFGAMVFEDFLKQYKQH